MGGFWLDKEIQDLLDLWLTRILVFLSFTAHLYLALFAGIRRREDSGMLRKLVWFAYQVTDMAPKAALGKLYLVRPSADQLLFAFWVPFLLLHLGLPDNISAYSPEDNELSGRKVADIGLQLFGVGYGAYKLRFMSSDRELGSAFVMMFLLGCYKYVERACALWQAGFDQIQSSNKKKRLRRFSAVQSEHEQLDNDDALLDAHGLLGITMGAFADYSVHFKQGPDKKPITSYSCWNDVVKVVEMELSLMYDIMYTKVAVIHTRRGYIIRLVSPIITATTFLLFHFSNKESQKGVDIKITYILLVVTLLLDVTWLLRALGSTWTYAFLKDTKHELLKKTLCCRRGWWYALRRLVFSLDPSRLSISRCRCWKDESSHRMWSRTVGQHNLLHECTGAASMKKIRWEDRSTGLVTELLEELCVFILKQLPKDQAFQEKEQPADYGYDYAEAPYNRRRKFAEARGFGPEFDELIITWHIATDVFLLSRPESKKSFLKKPSQKIKALSDYMMFLVDKRPEMLPGMKLRSNYHDIRKELKGMMESVANTREYIDRKMRLAKELRLRYERDPSKMHIILREATQYAKLLEMLCQLEPNSYYSEGWERIVCAVGIKDESEKRLLYFVPELEEFAKPAQPAYMGWPTEDILMDIILSSWVRLLTFASIRCSRDSHAKQLSRGGEFTTIIWILAEHSDIVMYENEI